MTVAITGHRPNKLWNDYDLTSSHIQMIKAEIIIQLNNLCPDKCISGMALGIDTLFAIIAIQNNIPLTAAIPFKGQELMWPSKSQVRYNRILDKANKVVIVSEGGYNVEKMQIRNQWMVDHCDHLIAVWDKTPGGTANCVQYALHVKKDITFINPRNY